MLPHTHAHLLPHCWQFRNVMRAGRYRGASPAKWLCCEQTRIRSINDPVVCAYWITAPWLKYGSVRLKLALYPPTMFREILRIIHPQYSVRFSELTAITSLNGIKSFVLLTEKQWIFNSPGMLRYVGFQIFTDVSEDCNAFFFQGQVV